MILIWFHLQFYHLGKTTEYIYMEFMNLTPLYLQLFRIFITHWVSTEHAWTNQISRQNNWFDFRRMTDKQTDICNSRVAFATEKGKCNLHNSWKHYSFTFVNLLLLLKCQLHTHNLCLWFPCSILKVFVEIVELSSWIFYFLRFFSSYRHFIIYSF